jgi:hypothetical protein
LTAEYEPLLDSAASDPAPVTPPSEVQSRRDDGWQSEARGLFILTVALFVGLAVMRAIASQGVF